jgi:hypothetical protein
MQLSAAVLLLCLQFTAAYYLPGTYPKVRALINSDHNKMDDYFSTNIA